MAVIKRQSKISTGSKGWPKLARSSKIKQFKEIPKLKKIKTAMMPTPEDSGEESENEENADNHLVKHFKKTSHFFKKL